MLTSGDVFACQVNVKNHESNSVVTGTRPSPYGPVYKMDWSVGITYEQSAVKVVVRVLKSGTVI